MSTQVNPRIITDGLLVNFDAPTSLPNANKNFLTFPEDLTNAAWERFASGTGTLPVVVANFAPSPDGSSTADLVTFSSGGNGNSQISNGGTIQPTVGTVRTFSVWMRTLTGTTDISMFNSESIQVVTVTSTWQRFVYPQSITSAGAFGTRLAKREIWSSGGTGSVLIWGAQWEDGSTATEYFPVSGNKTATTWTNLVVTPPPPPSTPPLTSVEVLVVAGGGSGGYLGGGGGGGGGVVYNPVYPVFNNTTYSVTIGIGGTFNVPIGTGFSGTNSSISGSGSPTITALGGGGGGSGTDQPAVSGGSGGGGGGTSGAVGLGTPGQGNTGGAGMTFGTGGGGGGAGSPGSTSVSFTGGAGGAGRALSISGTSSSYGGGGGGGTIYNINGGAGGAGGGGAGGFSGGVRGSPGITNTGGGGGGGGNNNPINGSLPADGGSGIVIIRYPQPVRATGGVISLVNNDVVHTFTSGTSNFVVSFVVTNTSRAFNNNPSYSNLNGGMLTFNGTNQSVDIPSNVLNTVYTGKTVIVTARMNRNFGIGVFRGLVGGGGVNRNFNTYIYSDTTGYRIHFSYGANTVFSGGFSNYLAISLGQWFTIAVTQDTAGNVNCYLNGVNAGTATGVTFSQYIANSETEYIGRADGFWFGDIAQTKIYSRALTAAEIIQNYQSIQTRFSSTAAQLANYDGSSLSGWTTVGVTVNGGIGNAAPSFYVNAGQYGYIAPATITSFANTTITFSVNITSTASLCNLFFAANASGMGTMLRLEGRTGTPSGFMAPTNWNTWDSGPSSGPTLAANTWYNIKIQITPAGLATWYLDGALQVSTASVRLLGNHIGIHGDGAGTGAYFDNITVYSGIV